MEVLATADGRVAQRNTSTANQKTILAALDLPEPPKYLDFDTRHRRRRRRLTIAPVITNVVQEHDKSW